MKEIKITALKNEIDSNCFNVYNYLLSIGFIDSEELKKDTECMYLYDFFELLNQMDGIFDNKMEFYKEMKSMMDPETFALFNFELLSISIDSFK